MSIKLSKRVTFVILVLLVVCGSLLSVVADNMLAADIGNIAVGLSNSTILASLPSACFATLFVMAILYTVRLYHNPNVFKRMTRLYLIIACALGFVGFLGALISGILIYNSFVLPYPFPGYLIIFMVVHVLVMGGSITGIIFVNKMEEDKDKVKINFLYVLQTIGWFLFIALLLNRFGFFLTCPFYIYWRNLYLTFPFYLFLMCSGLIGLLFVALELDLFKTKKVKMICSISLTAVVVLLFIAILIIGGNETAMISAVSPTMPLERLASMPLEIMIHFIAYLGVLTVSNIRAAREYKNEKRGEN